MRATIESVATCSADRGSSRELAIRAGREALARTGRAAASLGVLVSTGIYRDENIVEPAMAPFIERGLRGCSRVAVRDHGTFSFDLGNGPCGFVNAMQVVDGFIQSGTVDLGLVVASDAQPYQVATESPEVASSAAAVLLGAGSGTEGFAAFSTRTFGEHSSLFQAVVGGGSSLPGRAFGRGAAPVDLRIFVDERYAEACVECARTTVEQFSEEVIPLDEVDLIVPSQGPPGFVQALGRRLGVQEKIVDLTARSAASHTASCAYALEAAVVQGRFHRAKRVLFLTVGAGITVAVGLYSKEAGSMRTPRAEVLS